MSETVIHTPCGRDWTDWRGHHECRYTMDHRGLCVARTAPGEHPSLIGNDGITLCPVEGVTTQIDKDDGTCWACGAVIAVPREGGAA